MLFWWLLCVIQQRCDVVVVVVLVVMVVVKDVFQPIHLAAGERKKLLFKLCFFIEIFPCKKKNT